MLLLVSLICFCTVFPGQSLTLVSKIRSSVGVPRIINGNQAEPGQFPWQVGVLNIISNLDLHFCNGAIIAEDWILTSASCIAEANLIGVYSGVVDISDPNRGMYTTSDYIVHEDFDNATQRNDIGLVRLNSKLVFDDNTKPIALAEEELGAEVEVTVSGWGHSNHDDGIDNTFLLQYITVSTIGNSDCQEIYGSDVVSDGVVCTRGQDPVRNPCAGDSGAPLVTNAASPIHVGIYSFMSALGCEQDYPAGYTRTAYYREWIRSKTGV